MIIDKQTMDYIQSKIDEGYEQILNSQIGPMVIKSIEKYHDLSFYEDDENHKKSKRKLRL